MGFQANRTEGAVDSIIFFLLTIPVCYTIAHYATLTTYVLFIEILLSVVPLVLFSPIELLVSIVGFFKFK